MKRGIYILCFSLILILTLSMVSAGAFSNLWGKITGKAQTANVGLNISVTGGSAPIIIGIYNQTMTDFSSGLNEGPAKSYISIIFGVNDADGIGNVNNATPKINFSISGEPVRQNTSCIWVSGQSTATSANYTCNITMWWFDAPGTWDISAYIADFSSNIGYNHTAKTFSIGPVMGFIANQTTVNWSAITPGASNQEAGNIIGLNNTGNTQKSIWVNASDLRGDSNPTYALGANNFSAKNAGGCEGTLMQNRTDVNVTSIQIPRGNYTWNNATGQVNVYFCLETSNSNLIAQSYSTQNTGAWIIKVGS